MDKVKFVAKAWEVLEDIEALSRASMASDLVGWETIVRNCIEAGALVPMLPAKNHGQFRLLAAAPFLKRSLTDLRSLWLLIRLGYTSQAGGVAASLYENALTAAVLADSEELAKKAASTKYSEIPWPAKTLAQLDAKRALRITHKSDSYAKKEYEDNWTISYFNYRWLCQIKHPTWQSAFHDVTSTLINESEYAVFPLPCNLEEDMHLKYVILGGGVSKTLEAVKSYFLSLECEEGAEGYDVFEAKVNEVHFGVVEQMKRYADKSPPVNVIDRRFVKTDFSTLIEKYED